MILGILGLCGVILVLPQVEPLASTWGFKPAPATILRIERQIFPASRSLSALFSGRAKLRPWSEQQELIVYSYTVNGRAYEGTDVLSGARKGPLTIYYDPGEPARSVAKHPPVVRVLAELALAFGLVFYGFAGRRRRSSA